MMSEKINEMLKKEFIENKNSITLEKYVMSEVLSPVGDYINAISIIKDNIKLTNNYNLYFVGAYLSLELFVKSNYFLDELNRIVDSLETKDKAIVFYLNACYLSCFDKNYKTSKDYKEALLKSIANSNDIPFVNNYIDLSKISDGKKEIDCLIKALSNVVCVETEEILGKKPIEYWLSSEKYINEFILGNELSEPVYRHMFQKILG